MDVTLTESYVKGVLAPVLKVAIVEYQELNKIVTIKASYGLENVRVSIPKHLELKENNDLGLQKVYNHYKLDLSSCEQREIKSRILVFDKTMTEEGIQLVGGSEYNAQLTDQITQLVQECYQRQPSEFSSDGTDPSWYFLGDKVLLSISDEDELMGFRVFEEKSGYVKMWFGYVAPKYREIGVYSDLFNHLVGMYKTTPFTYLTVATDCTDGNPMLDILPRLGFKLDSVTYKNTN